MTALGHSAALVALEELNVFHGLNGSVSVGEGSMELSKYFGEGTRAGKDEEGSSVGEAAEGN